MKTNEALKRIAEQEEKQFKNMPEWPEMVQRTEDTKNEMLYYASIAAKATAGMNIPAGPDFETRILAEVYQALCNANGIYISEEEKQALYDEEGGAGNE